MISFSFTIKGLVYKFSIPVKTVDQRSDSDSSRLFSRNGFHPGNEYIKKTDSGSGLPSMKKTIIREFWT
jgi:hypothetical protein